MGNLQRNLNLNGKRDRVKTAKTALVHHGL
jgi:hypothetical protein